MSVPDDRRYSRDHQWVQASGSIGPARVGVTDFAQEALGEITLVRLHDQGVSVARDAEMGEVEAFKAMSDLYMPVTAAIVDINPLVLAEPNIVNRDPYGDGWLCTVAVDDTAELDGLLDATAYRALIGMP